MSLTARYVTATKTGAYTAKPNDVVPCDATTGGFSVALPAPMNGVGLAPITVGPKLDIGSNVVTITSPAGMIHGVAALSAQNDAVTYVSNGTDWFAVSFSGAGSSAATVPDAPTIGTAAAGNASAIVTFTPNSDGGNARIGCRITPYIGSTAQTPQVFSTTATTQTCTGLTNGTAYTFKVEDRNGVGFSLPSTASNSVTPSATPVAPDAPTIGTATAGNTQAVANWTAPASDGGSAITGYQVKTYDSTGTLLATNTTGVVLTYTKTGLTNGTDVKFKVAAINAVGTGAQSAFSNTVTPAAPGFSDNFNRADSATTLGPNWTKISGQPTDVFGINSNQMYFPVFAGGSRSIQVAETLLVDCTVGVDVIVNDGDIGLAFRAADGNNYMIVMLVGGGVFTTAVVAGVSSNLQITGYGSLLPAVPFRFECVLAGDQLTAKLDGNTLPGFPFTIPAPTQAALGTNTKAGIGTGLSAAPGASRLDNFSVA